MLVIEGPDGSGKTTLAHKLQNDLKLRYRRPPSLSSTEGANRQVYEWWLAETRRDSAQEWLRNHSVYDRCFFISEKIYQPVMSGRELITSPQEIMDGVIQFNDCSPDIIFCLPPFKLTLQTIHDHPERALKGVSDEDLYQIYWSYWGEFAAWSNTNWGRTTMWDYTCDEYRLIKEWVAVNGRTSANAN